MEKDIFELLHTKTRNGELKSALSCVLDFDLAKIRKPYDKDLNHSWYLVGNIYFRLGDFSQSLRAFRTAYLKNNNDYAAAKAIGNCYSELGKYKMAERYFRRALLLKRDDEELMYNLGNSLFDQKKYSDAICMYKKVLSSELKDEDLMIMAENNLLLAESKRSKQG